LIDGIENREREREVAVPLRIRVSDQPNRRIIVGLLAGPVRAFGIAVGKQF
jgi:hypothetical protein